MSKASIIAGVILSFVLVYAAFGDKVYPEEYSEGITNDSNDSIEKKSDTNKAERSKNINIDMQILYGQYNNVLSTVNLSNEEDDFVYLLSSDFKRSNDFGYKDKRYDNTSFYENRIGFTGNLNIFDTWKSILESEVNNDSRGMFDNEVYNREEKDKIRVSLKNISKIFSNSFEGYITLGGAGYVHRLRPVNPEDTTVSLGSADQEENGLYQKSRLYQGNVEVGGEYIWSASNRIKFKSGVLYYDYSTTGVDDDLHTESELIDDFNITRNFGISIGVNYDYNYDEPWIISPLVGLSLKGFKYFSSVLLYRYDIAPFDPEDFYLEQKYIKPTYNLPPGKVHHGDVKVDFRMNSRIKLKGNFVIEKNNKYYNYYPLDGNLLTAEAIAVVWYYTRVDTNCVIYKKLLEITLSYEYSFFDAEDNITYYPNHNFLNSIVFNGKEWKLEWSNKIKGKVYTDPDEDEQIDEVVIGYFGIQRKMINGFYAYLRVENLYNHKYTLREDYPEPGFSLLGGLRILI